MITRDKLRKTLRRTYTKYLEAWLDNEDDFFPYQIPVGSIPRKDYVRLRDGVRALQTDADKWGYELEYVTQIFQKLGEQTFPTQIIIPSQDVMLSMLSKKNEFRTYQKDVDRIRNRLPQLETWLRHNIDAIIKYADEWDDLLNVCEYFIAHPHPNCYIRELPIVVHTKFVENHTTILSSLLDDLLPFDTISNSPRFESRYGLKYDVPLFRLRLLDDNLRLKYWFPFSDFSVRLPDLATQQIDAQRCVIVENKMTFLTLPPMQNSWAIWGEGKKVALLRELDWLKNIPVYYWGDIDTDGFAILSQLRSYFPHVHSIMMDELTYQTFNQYSVTHLPNSTPKLNNLTTKEERLYYQLIKESKRLEQEHITHTYALSVLENID